MLVASGLQQQHFLLSRTLFCTWFFEGLLGRFSTCFIQSESLLSFFDNFYIFTFSAIFRLNFFPWRGHSRTCKKCVKRGEEIVFSSIFIARRHLQTVALEKKWLTNSPFLTQSIELPTLMDRLRFVKNLRFLPRADETVNKKRLKNLQIRMQL